jgi:hypothetical protein
MLYNVYIFTVHLYTCIVKPFLFTIRKVNLHFLTDKIAIVNISGNNSLMWNVIVNKSRVSWVAQRVWARD